MDGKILVLGGYGETGRRIARLLLERTEAKIVIGGRNLDRAIQLADQLNKAADGNRVSAVRLDTGEQMNINSALGDVSLLINAGPALPEPQLRSLTEAAIEAGADWIDIQVDPHQELVLKQYENEMVRNDCCFLTQGGFHPGLPALLVRWAAGGLERLHTANLAAFLNMEGGLPFTSGVDELIEMFRDYRADVFHNRSWQTLKGGMNDMKKEKFPFEIGLQWTAPMSLDELRALPGIIPSLDTLGFYIGGFNWMTNIAFIPLISIGLKILPMVSYRRWGKLLSWSSRVFNHPPYGSCLQIEARGERKGEPAILRFAVFHPDGYHLTAISVVAAVEQIFERSIRRPGLHFAAHLPEPERVLKSMKEMGVSMRIERVPG